MGDFRSSRLISPLSQASSAHIFEKLDIWGGAISHFLWLPISFMKADLQAMKVENRPKKKSEKGHKRGKKLIHLNQNQAKNQEKYCSVNELAAILNLSSRRIQQLTQAGIFKKTGHGRYELFGCLKAYFKYLKRLIRRYAGLYKYCIGVCRKRKTNFENLSCYEDIANSIETFTDEEFREWFSEKK